MYVEKEKYNNLTVDSSYSDFMERFHPLSGTDVEGNQPPAEKKLSWKQRKRRNKMFKEWYQLKVDDAKVIPRLVFAEDLKKMEMFSSWDKKDREHWEKQVLPHSKLTRGETLRRIIEEGDYSNFENLDELMRNRVATLTHVPDLITVASYYRKKKSKDPSGDAADAIKANNAQQIPVEEKKVSFNFTGQRGMNCAIGGLGNNGVGGELLSNDGSCGHFYSMYKEADAEHYGSMLMGLESDAAGVMNQMGHTHDMFATPEKASSLGAQRTDEEGEKYGGRQCDLTAKSAGEIAYVLIALEKKCSNGSGRGT